MCMRLEYSLYLRSRGSWACLTAVTVRDFVGRQMINAHGSPEKCGQLPGDPFSCRPAVGPLRASTSSFLASALPLDWLSFPMAWGVWSFRSPSRDNCSDICSAPVAGQAHASALPYK